MFWCKHTLAVWMLICLAVGPVYAFNFSYGEAFTVSGIEQENGRIKMPLRDKKYHNTKILAKPLYDFLLTCQRDCSYPVQKIDFVSTDYRRAVTNEQLIIAQVDFNQEIRMTFLVFKKADSISVKAPQEVYFRDKNLQKQVENYLKQLVQTL